MTRDEMMERMSSTEFMQWQVLASIEPFGDLRSDIQTALLASTITNMSGKSVRRNVELRDFVIDYIKPPVVQSVEDMHATFVRILEAANRKAASKSKPN